MDPRCEPGRCQVDRYLAVEEELVKEVERLEDLRVQLSEDSQRHLDRALAADAHIATLKEALLFIGGQLHDARRRLEAVEGVLDTICTAWDDFDEALIEMPPAGSYGIKIRNDANMWQAHHHMDNLVADWQLRDSPTPPTEPTR